MCFGCFSVCCSYLFFFSLNVCFINILGLQGSHLKLKCIRELSSQSNEWCMSSLNVYL